MPENDSAAPPPETGTTAVLIVNFRTPNLTIDAVESALTEPEVTEVIVVDNASGDGSVADLRARFALEARVRILESDRNIGFGQGTNLAAASSRCEFLLLLNSDAVLVRGCVAALLAERAALKRPAVVAPTVLDANSGDVQEDSIGLFPTAWRTLRQTTKRRVRTDSPDWVSGCAFLIDRTLFETVGGFDSEIFMYFEDVLLCWQVRRTGAPIRRSSVALVRHHGGKSATKPMSQKRNYFDSQDIYFLRTGESRLNRLLVRVARSLKMAEERRNGH